VAATARHEGSIRIEPSICAATHLEDHICRQQDDKGYGKSVEIGRTKHGCGERETFGVVGVRVPYLAIMFAFPNDMVLSAIHRGRLVCGGGIKSVYDLATNPFCNSTTIKMARIPEVILTIGHRDLQTQIQIYDR